MKTPFPPRRFLPPLLAAFFVSALTSPAQTASSAAATEPDEKSEVVTLTEFNVTSTSAQSEYVAAESITGTRVASKIRDLPFTVNVVTSEFLDDFAAYEFREQTAYTSNVVGFETISTGYSVRGVDANVQLRNGFRRIGLIDKVNVDRVEVIKGAAASIYGTVMPGGTVNIITKRPGTKPQHRINVSGGSNAFIRAQASSTGPAGKSGKFFYRADVGAERSEYDIDFKEKDQWTAVGQLLWKPAPVTSLLFEYEYLERHELGNATVPYTRGTIADPYRLPLASGAARTYNAYLGIAENIFDFNFAGPDVRADRYVHTLSATLEHRFNQHVSLRSSANWFERGLTRQEFGGRDQYDPTTDTVAIGVPRLRPFPEGGANWQTDLLASWKSGPVHHKTLLTFDYQRQTEKPEQWDSATRVVRINGQNRNVPIAFAGALATINALPTTIVSGSPVPTLTVPKGGSWMLGEVPTVINYDNSPGIAVNNPYYRLLTYNNDPSTYTLRQKEDNALDIFGVFFSERATFFEERATLLAGLRYDYVKSHSRNLNPSAPLESRDRTRSTDEISYQLGANVRVLPAVTAYANLSRSFVPDFSAGIDEFGESFDVPPEIGESWEVGFKTAAFGERLTFTTAYFDIARDNVRRTATTPDGSVTYDVVTGRETSKGFEFDFNWVATESLQFFGGYGYTDAKIVSNVSAPAFENGPTRRTPKHSLGIGGKYTVKAGALKGLYLTAGYKYAGKSRPTGPGGRTLVASYNANPASSSFNPIINRPMPNGQLPFPDRPVNDIIGDTPDEHGLRAIVNDGRDTISNDAYDLFEAGIGYRWKTNRRFNHRVQLNVSNLLDERYTYGSTGQGAGRGFVVSYELGF